MGRLRIFAGPNGSGKSTLFGLLHEQVNLGPYLNADDLLREMNHSGLVDLCRYGVSSTQHDWKAFWSSHGLRNQARHLAACVLQNDLLVFKEELQSYEGAVLTDFLRHLILQSKQTFSFETVFSHEAKVEFIKQANQKGYRTYLYFVSTHSPDLCIERVQERALDGGHEVPEEKIRSRYFRALENLLPAIRLAYWTFIFDNSSKEMDMIAEVTPKKTVLIRTDQVPVWFQTYVQSQLTV